MSITRLLIKTVAVATLMAISALLFFSSAALAQLQVNTSDNHVKIGVFYHGSTIDLSGVTDPQTELIVKVVSPESNSVLREKARVGIFWMNKGQLKFEHVPNLYILYSTKGIGDILSQKEMDNYVIGYSALKKHIEIDKIKTQSEKTRWFNEFVKFKEAAGLYNVITDGSSIIKKSSDWHYNIKINWPYQAPPGHYKVTVYEVRNEKVIRHSDTGITVKQDGFVKSIADMARKNGALYGVVSIVIALVVGFGISLVFRKT